MDDDIDRVTAQLKADRPSLDVETIGLSGRVIRLARHVEIARREVLAGRDLEGWEYDVLVALRAAGAPHELSPSALMAATQVASGTVTNRIDRLVRRGFVSREPDPADRRGVLVRLSQAGRKRADLATADVAKAEREIWHGLTERKRDQLTALLRELLAAADS